MLGVRVPEDGQPGVDGFVHPGGGGMSAVADDPLDMPPWLLPGELGGTSRKGLVYEMDAAHVRSPLTVRADGPPHHLIEPAESLPLAGFRIALGSTRPHWRTWS
jgi:hypothetical protein